jgi:gluconolactonase
MESLFSSLPVPEKVAEGFAFPEGVSVARDGSLFLVNCDDDRIHRVTPSGQVSVFARVRGKGNGSKFRSNGTLVVCDYIARAIVEVDTSGRVRALATHDVDNEPFSGPNDLVIARNGDLYFTSPQGSDKENPVGKVYHYSAAHKVTTIVAEGLAFPNGLSLNGEESALYIAETFYSRIWKFVVLESGRLEAGRIFATIPGGHYPDGMDFDVEGNLYVAYFGSGNVVVLSPSGTVVAELPAGGKNPTNLAFGGPKGDWLYVTEAETNSLYVLKIGKRGLHLPPVA